MKFLLLLCTLLLAGCAGLMTPNSSLSAEQIAASAKAKDANVVCITGSGPWGKVTSTFVNVDKGTVQMGGVRVDESCQVIYQNANPIAVARPPIST